MDINYDDIDPGIRDTVRKLNDNGFKTIQSCDGIAEHHPNRTEQKRGWISFEKTPKTIDLLAACFRDRKNFSIVLRNINLLKEFGGIEYYITFYNARGELTPYLNGIIDRVIDGTITVSESEKGMLTEMESILEDRNSELGFTIKLDQESPVLGSKKTERMNCLEIIDCSSNRNGRNLSSLRDSISQRFGIPQKISLKDGGTEGTFIYNKLYSAGGFGIYFSDEDIERILGLMRYSKKVEETWRDNPKEKNELADYDITPWDAEL